MKRTTLIVGMLMLAAVRLAAQSALPDPAHMKLEYEDERVRVIRFVLPAGQATPTMDLNERLTTCFTDATLRITKSDALVNPSSAQSLTTEHEAAGQVLIENVGTTEWQCVITEFKPPYARAQQPLPPQAAQQPVTKPQEQQVTPPTVVMPPHPAPQAGTPAAQVAVPTPAQPPPMQQPPAAVEATALNTDGAKMAFLNGIELAYIERGQGPLVVLVHDTLGDYRSWAQQITALSRNYRVVAYSRRYHYPNHSSGKERDYSYDINAKDLADFIKGLNAGPVRLVGFGYGASVAGMVAAEHPELVKALVITEPGYEQLLDKTMAFRSQFAREEIYGIIRKPLTKDRPEKGVQVYVDWQGYQSWSGISTEEQFRKKQNSNALHAQTLDASAPNFNCASARKIIAPTLILSGQRRSPNSAEIAGVLSGCIPNAERATVANAGAAVYVDNPQEADKLLVEFLAKH